MNLAYDDNEDRTRLAASRRLRADLLSGDMRLFYLLWLTVVETDAVEATDLEPLLRTRPLDDALEAFADFFQLDWGLVQAAAERPVGGSWLDAPCPG